MAAPTLTLLNSTSINTAEATTGWTLFDTLDTDIKKEGSNGITGTFRNDLTSGYYDHGSAPVTAVDKTVRLWINTTNVPYMETWANGGYELLAYDGTTSQYITVFSSDDYFGGWFNIVMDMNDFTSLTLANVQRWGIRINHHTSAKNVDNMWADALKYLDGYSMTGGSAVDPITLEDIEIADRGTTTLYGYGVITVFGGVFYCTGNVQFGTGATTMYFEMDGDILVFEDKPVASGLYSLSGIGTGSDVVIQNSVIISAGTTDDTRFAFDWSDTDLASFSCTDNRIVRAATSTFKSGQTVTGNTFDNCGQIVAAGANMGDCIIKSYEGTVDTGALNWNVATDPNTYLNGASFTKGTAATHAIEFGTTSPLTMTLTNVTVSGYNASDSQTDSTLYIARTTGTVTINLIGCSGTITYKSAGATVNIVNNPVTVEVHAVDNQGNDIASALVYLKAKAKSSGTATTDTLNKLVDTNATFETDGVAIGDTAYNQTDGTSALVTAVDSETALSFASDLFPDGNEDYRVGGPYPVQDPVTIVNSGTLATVTHPAHDMLNNDYVYIQGGSLDANRGVFQITYISVDSYSYTMASTPGSSPTGTITSTFLALFGLTDANGDKSVSRVYDGDQDVEGWIRKSSVSPYWKEAPISGTIDSASGISIIGVLTPDE